ASKENARSRQPIDASDAGARGARLLEETSEQIARLVGDRFDLLASQRRVDITADRLRELLGEEPPHHVRDLLRLRLREIRLRDQLLHELFHATIHTSSRAVFEPGFELNRGLSL